MELVLEYLANCFWLIIPVVAFNIIFAGRLPKEFLPDIFEKGIPQSIVWGENAFRSAVFLLPLFMPLRLTTDVQRIGMVVYLTGLLVYFGSWAVLIAGPRLIWSRIRTPIK